MPLIELPAGKIQSFPGISFFHLLPPPTSSLYPFLSFSLKFIGIQATQLRHPFLRMGEVSDVDTFKTMIHHLRERYKLLEAALRDNTQLRQQLQIVSEGCEKTITQLREEICALNSLLHQRLDKERKLLRT